MSFDFTLSRVPELGVLGSWQWTASIFPSQIAQHRCVSRRALTTRQEEESRDLLHWSLSGTARIIWWFQLVYRVLRKSWPWPLLNPKSIGFDRRSRTTTVLSCNIDSEHAIVTSWLVGCTSWMGICGYAGVYTPAYPHIPIYISDISLFHNLK